MVSKQKKIQNIDKHLKNVCFDQWETDMVLTSPIKAIASISTRAPNGSFDGWIQVRAGKSFVNTEKL